MIMTVYNRMTLSTLPTLHVVTGKLPPTAILAGGQFRKHEVQLHKYAQVTTGTL